MGKGDVLYHLKEADTARRPMFIGPTPPRLRAGDISFDSLGRDRVITYQIDPEPARDRGDRGEDVIQFFSEDMDRVAGRERRTGRVRSEPTSPSSASPRGALVPSAGGSS